MTWERLPALNGRGNPCLCCPPILSKLSLRRRIGVGFGFAALVKDGQPVWTEGQKDWDELLTVVQAERMARADPDHDWRIILDGPLHGETYQRQGSAEWVLVETNEGFV